MHKVKVLAKILYSLFLKFVFSFYVNYDVLVVVIWMAAKPRIYDFKKQLHEKLFVIINLHSKNKKMLFNKKTNYKFHYVMNLFLL